MTPTQRTLKYMKDLGYKVGIVEKWVTYAPNDPRKKFKSGERQDLFGIIDIIAINDVKTIGVQSTGSAFSEHLKKLTEPYIDEKTGEMINKYTFSSISWLLNPNRELWLIGWRKVKKVRGGKAMIWEPRIEKITIGMIKLN